MYKLTFIRECGAYIESYDFQAVDASSEDARVLWVCRPHPLLFAFSNHDLPTYTNTLVCVLVLLCISVMILSHDDLTWHGMSSRIVSDWKNQSIHRKLLSMDGHRCSAKTSVLPRNLPWSIRENMGPHGDWFLQLISLYTTYSTAGKVDDCSIVLLDSCRQCLYRHKTKNDRFDFSNLTHPVILYMSCW